MSGRVAVNLRQGHFKATNAMVSGFNQQFKLSLQIITGFPPFHGFPSFLFILTVKTEKLDNIMIWVHSDWMNLLYLTLMAQCQVLIKSVRQNRHTHRSTWLPHPLIHNGLCSLFSTFNFLYRLRRLQPDANIRTKPVSKSRREMKVAPFSTIFFFNCISEKFGAKRKKAKKKEIWHAII